MPELPPLIRSSTAKNFLKAITDLRIGEDAADRLIALFTKQATQVATVAADLAQKADRTTLLDEDIQQAYDAQFDKTVSELLDPKLLHHSINTIDTDDLKTLIKLLMKDLHAEDIDEEDDQG